MRYLVLLARPMSRHPLSKTGRYRSPLPAAAEATETTDPTPPQPAESPPPRPRRFPPLDAERQRLVLDNIGLAYYVAQREYRKHGAARLLEYEDWTAEAVLALCRAASRNEPERHGYTGFAGFAGVCIRNHLDEVIREVRQSGRTPKRRPSSLSYPLAGGPTDAAGVASPLCNHLECHRNPAPEYAPEVRDELRQVRQVLPSEWFLLLWRYFADGLTLRAIGRTCGAKKGSVRDRPITKEAVRQRIAKAFRLLRLKMPGATLYL